MSWKIFLHIICLSINPSCTLFVGDGLLDMLLTCTRKLGDGMYTSFWDDISCGENSLEE